MMYLVFLMILFPLIDFVGLFVGAATQYLATNDICSKAATQADYPTALSTMVTEADGFQSLGLAKFLNLTPNGGFTGCGNDLYVLATDTGSGTTTTSVADQPPAAPIVSTDSYEMTVKSNYTLSPWINMSCIPILGLCPGLGQPANLSFAASRAVEHADGLQPSSGGSPTGGTGGTGGGSSVTPFPRISTSGGPGVPPTPGGNTWNTPDIYNRIQTAGQTVVSVSVMKIPARLLSRVIVVKIDGIIHRQSDRPGSC